VSARAELKGASTALVTDPLPWSLPVQLILLPGGVGIVCMLFPNLQLAQVDEKNAKWCDREI
jgi:hypothetical protein